MLDPLMGCAVQLLRFRSCRNESRRRLSFLGAPSGSGDWIASELLQLREQGTSPSFDRMSRLVQYRVSACWHRGHLGLRCLRFADDGFCRRFDARRFAPRVRRHQGLHFFPTGLYTELNNRLRSR